MERGKIEDFIDRSDEKLRQFPADLDPAEIYNGLSCLSHGLKDRVYSHRLVPDPVMSDPKSKAIQTAYFSRKIPEYCRNSDYGKTAGESLEDSVRMSEPQGNGPEMIGPPMHQTAFKGEQKLQEAERLMREGFRSLEKAKSESPALNYDDNLEEQELSDLDNKSLSYCIKIYKSTETLDRSQKLFRDILDSEKDPDAIGEAQRNFYKTKIHSNFEKGRLGEAYQTFNFLLRFSDNSPVIKAIEERASNQNALKETTKDHLVINTLMFDSLSLNRTGENFRNAMAACDEAARLGYHDAVPEGCKTLSEESIRRIEDRTLRLDGAIALRGHDLVHAALTIYSAQIVKLAAEQNS